MSCSNRDTMIRSELLINGYFHEIYDNNHHLANDLIGQCLNFCGLVFGVFDVGDVIDCKFGYFGDNKYYPAIVKDFEQYPFKIHISSSSNREITTVIKTDLICDCYGVCNDKQHIIAQFGTQSIDFDLNYDENDYSWFINDGYLESDGYVDNQNEINYELDLFYFDT